MTTVSQLRDTDARKLQAVAEIQPFGCLLCVQSQEARILAVSETCEGLLGLAAGELLGKRLAQVIGPAGETLARLIRNQPADSHDWSIVDLPDARRPGFAASKVCLTQRLDEERSIVELIPLDTAWHSPRDLDLFRQDAITAMERCGDLASLCQTLVDRLRLLLGYHRVMIYRFAGDEHAEVIAESSCLEGSCLGLCLEASDISQTVRRSLGDNLVRLTVDVEAASVPVVARPGDTAAFDLSRARLSPVPDRHRELLASMGARAGFALGLTVGDRLWGMIACQHRTSRRPPESEHAAAELLARVGSAFIERAETAARQEAVHAAREVANGVERDTYRLDSLEASIERHEERIRALVGADSLILRLGDSFHSYGADHDVGSVLPQLLESSEEDFQIVAAPRLGAQGRNLGSAPCAAGLLFVLDRDAQDLCFLGRSARQIRRLWRCDREPGDKTYDGRVNWEERIVADEAPPLSAEQMEAGRVLAQALSTLYAQVALDRLERQAEDAETRVREAEEREAALRRDLFHFSRLTSMGALASGLAHEVNQPLAAANNFAAAAQELLRRSTLPPQEQEPIQALLTQGIDQIGRAGNIVRRLRQFVERGELERSVTNVHQLLRDAVQLVQSTRSGKPIPVSWSLSNSLPPVSLDRVQITQVAFNLVSNAYDALQETERPRLKISCRHEAPDKIVIGIADNGPGIPDDVAEKLFYPFNSTKKNGMGIGLSLCRTIVEAHGGRIELEPQAQGACFRITLPTATVG